MMMLMLSFWAGFLACGLLILGGIWVLNKLGLLGTSHPDFNSLEAQYNAQLEAHKSSITGQLFKLAEDMNKSLNNLQVQIQAVNTPTKEAPFYLPEDAQPEKRFKPQLESEFRSVGGAGVP